MVFGGNYKMDEGRKNAYRNLLYRAMIDIRVLCQSTSAASCNALEWYRQYHRSLIAGALADWLHNLAMYAARDFEGFDEELFWKAYDRVLNRFPNSVLQYYRALFERFLQEPERTGMW
jgi:hypothetical protein